MPTYHLLNFTEFRADELAGYVTDKHHSYARQAAEIIHDRLNHLMSMNDDSKEDYRHLWNLFDQLFLELDNHMRKEETILFPFVRKMVQADQGHGEDEFPSVTMVRNPIELLLKEHRRVSNLLQELRMATNHYKPADESSPTCKLCLAEMFDLDQDIQRHFYLEETVLYPKLIRLEEKLTASKTDAGQTSIE
jgi:regulator of cell morphogenesis and NO signaling